MENIAIQMGMNIKPGQSPYSFAHEYSRQMNYQSFKTSLGSGCNK